MTSEIPATPEPAAEPAPQATPPAQAEPTPAPDEPKPEAAKPEPDWRAAYIGLQRNLDRSQRRTEEVLEQNKALVGAVTSIKASQNELVKATLGEDKAKEIAARDAQALAQEAQRRAATAAQSLMEAQAEVLLTTLDANGIARNDPAIDWANNAGSVEEWKSRVTTSVKARIAQANEERIAAERNALTAKSKAEIKAEAEALAQRQLKASGVDQIDTARGQASSSLVERIRSLKPGSPEYQRFADEVARGTLKTK